MENLQVRENFTFDNGELQFHSLKILFSHNDEKYVGRCYKRLPSDRYNELSMQDLTDTILITRDLYCPVFQSKHTKASEVLAQKCHVKRVDLFQSGGELDLCRLVLRDVGACEILQLRPHPNVATYHGCQVQEDRIVGICFSRYSQTLMEKINPKSLNRQDFLLEPLEERRAAARRYLPGIARGIHHMHSLGLVHNEINPSNIMLDDKDEPVIIDFDSCLPFGVSLDQVKRTPGWYDEAVSTSLAENDLHALAEIETWLTSTNPGSFRFEGF